MDIQVSELEGSEYQDDTYVHRQPCPEPVLEEQDIDRDDHGYYQGYVKCGCHLALHFIRRSTVRRPSDCPDTRTSRRMSKSTIAYELQVRNTSTLQRHSVVPRHLQPSTIDDRGATDHAAHNGSLSPSVQLPYRCRPAHAALPIDTAEKEFLLFKHHRS
jgi:hypothetical protein